MGTRLSSGKKASEVAAELGVSGWSLNRWRKEMESSNVPISQLSGPIGELDNTLNALELAKDRGPM